MRKLLFTFTISFSVFFASCISFQINESGYRGLSYFEKEHLKSIDDNDTFSFLDDLSLIEVDSSDIKQLISTHKYSWIKVWNPVCSNESCTNIRQYEDLERKFKHHDFNLILISHDYNLSWI